MDALPGTTDALRVEAGFDGSTELGIRLGCGIDDVDHRTAEVGLDGLAAKFSFPAAAAVVRRKDEEEMDLGVSGRVAADVSVAMPRSLRREDMGGRRCRVRVLGDLGEEALRFLGFGSGRLIWDSAGEKGRLRIRIP
jgi:hypothetical protein